MIEGSELQLHATKHLADDTESYVVHILVPVLRRIIHTQASVCDQKLNPTKKKAGPSMLTNTIGGVYLRFAVSLR